MKQCKEEVLMGSALFVLQQLCPLNITEIVYVWGMYEDSFKDALSASNSFIYYEELSGPWWETPEQEQETLKRFLLLSGVAEEVEEIIKGEPTKSLRITDKGVEYLLILEKCGTKFEGKEELKRLKPEVIKYRKKEEEETVSVVSIATP